MTLSMRLRQVFAMGLKAWRIRTCFMSMALMFASADAMAADCDLRLSNSVVNYGALNRGEMEIHGNTLIDLGTRQLTMNAVCHQDTTMSVRFEGEAADSNSYIFAGKGRFVIKVSHVTLDGNPVLLARTSSGVEAEPAASSVQLRPNEGLVVISQGTRAMGKSFSARIEIQTYIDEATTRARDITALEGRGSLILDTQ